MSGIIPAVLGPGQGLFQGGTISLICSNQTDLTLTVGRVALFDVFLISATTFEEGGEVGASAFNTVIDTAPAGATLTGAFAGAEVGYVPHVLHQDESTADGSEGRFVLRGTGFGNYAGATAVGDAGCSSIADNQLRQPDDTPGANQSFSKIIAIAREAGATVLGEADVAECWIDGWAGFGSGVR